MSKKSIMQDHDGNIDVKEAKDHWETFEPENIADGKKPRKRKAPKAHILKSPLYCAFV